MLLYKLFVEISYDIADHQILFMWYLQNFHMPEDRKLFSVDDFFSNASIVQMISKPNISTINFVSFFQNSISTRRVTYSAFFSLTYSTSSPLNHLLLLSYLLVFKQYSDHHSFNIYQYCAFLICLHEGTIYVDPWHLLDFHYVHYAWYEERFQWNFRCWRFFLGFVIDSSTLFLF